MKCTNYSRLVAIYCLYQSCITTLPASTPEATFKSEAPLGWGRWKERGTTGFFAIRQHMTGKNNGTQVIDKVSIYERYALHSLIRIDSAFADKVVVASFLAGNDYGAFLQRPAPNSSFQIKWIGDPAEMRENLGKFTPSLKAFMIPYGVFGTPFEEIMSHKSFKIKSVDPVKNLDRLQYKIAFERIANDPNVPSYYDSWIIVDPHADWAIIESNTTTDPRKEAWWHIQNEYDFGSKPGVSLVSSTVVWKSNTEPLEERYEYQVIKSDPTPPDLKRFTLTDLGLTEPNRKSDANMSGSLRNWLFAGALILFGSAIGLNRASRRTA